MAKGRKPALFPVGHRTKAELAARVGPAYAVALGAKPPTFLSAAGKQEWKRVYPELVRLGIIKQVSVGALIGLCSAFASAMDAERDIKKNGQVISIPVVHHGKIVKGENGKPLIAEVRSNPAVKVARDAWAQYKSFSVELCLTPAAESKAPKTGEVKKLDELEAALCA